MMHRIIILFASIFALSAAFSFPANAQNTSQEYGKCGYYADALQGRKTASGEKYDKNLLTCSHKTLPFGTMIRVTRLDNKKSVVVRVNDRGPYIDGYVVDLSRKAAEQVGLIRDGVARVKTEIVEAKQAARPIVASNRTLPKELETSATAKPVTYNATPTAAAKAKLLTAKKGEVPATYGTTTAQPLTPSATGPAKDATGAESYHITIRPAEKKGFGLQVAALSSTEKLFQEVSKLQAIWPGKVIVNHEELKDLGLVSLKLIIGPYATRKEADAQMKKASSKGYKSAFSVDLSQ